MLESIRIQQFALIESAEIRFEKGLNILSGETGAGKSIVLEAIGLILGDRAGGGGRSTVDIIRSGADEAIVEGVFDISDHAELEHKLEKTGLQKDEDQRLIIKRSIHRNGKNKISINGQAATLQMLQIICEGLVDLCSQHEHQSLFKPETQLEWIDRFAKIDDSVARTRLNVIEFQGLCAQLSKLQLKDESRIQRLDFVRFQVKELDESALTPGIDEELLEKKQLLQSASQRTELVAEVVAALKSEDHSALDLIKAAIQRSKQLESLDSSTWTAIREGLDRAAIEIEEAIAQCERYADQIESDPRALDEVQGRLSLITQLKRKYGSTIEQILEHQNKLKAELFLLENMDHRVEELERAIVEKQIILAKQGVALLKEREKSADIFSKAVTKELQELRMENAKFRAEISSEGEVQNWTAVGCGSKAQYCVQTNAGEEQRPLAKIVSGGELSRLMLAIRRVLSDRGRIGVYLFDEIDAGIGGQTAFNVGRKLRTVAKHNQVICITHVPQVACFAEHHLSVSKQTTKGRTTSEIEVLSKTARREELARMLGAEKITPASLKNADELIAQAARI